LENCTCKTDKNIKGDSKKDKNTVKASTHGKTETAMKVLLFMTSGKGLGNTTGLTVGFTKGSGRLTG
jgi:hypothetical protein